MDQMVSYDKNLRVCCGRPHEGLRSISIESIFVYESVRIFLTSRTSPLSPDFNACANKDILKQSIDNGVFTNEAIEDMGSLQQNKQNLIVCNKMVEFSEGSNIGNFATLCSNNFKHERDSFRYKVIEASENLSKLQNKTHPFYRFLSPGGESIEILICAGSAHCENARKIR